MSDADAVTRKAALREQARKNRIAQPDKDAVSKVILDKFLGLPEYAAATTVLFYVDAGSEVRTRHSLADALASGKRIAVPYCLVQTNELELFYLEDVSELVEGAYKILEPKPELREQPGKRVTPGELDLVMVPGTGFDERGRGWARGRVTTTDYSPACGPMRSSSGSPTTVRCSRKSRSRRTTYSWTRS